MFTFVMTAVNTVFWIALHFGMAFVVTVTCKRFPPAPCSRFFTVSGREMRFYKAIRLDSWKDRLPQYGRDFDKSCLKKELSGQYIENFITATCRAELVHYSIAAAGYLSLLFCLFCDDPAGNLPIFAVIATFIALCNIPFSLIQRYNRFRLMKLLGKLKAREKTDAAPAVM